MGIFDFFKKNNNVENENGLNEIYFNQGKSKILKERFYKKNGKLDGLYEEFSLNDSHKFVSINYKDGKKHGEEIRYSTFQSHRGKNVKASIRNYKNDIEDGLEANFFTHSQRYLDNKKYNKGDIINYSIYENGEVIHYGHREEGPYKLRDLKKSISKKNK